MEEVEKTKLLLCTVCGLQGSFSCSACATSMHPVRYCCKRHQQVDWKAHRHVCGKNMNKDNIAISDLSVTEATDDVSSTAVLQHHKRNFTFAEYDIGIEEEDLEGGEDGNNDNEKDDNHDIKKALQSTKINPDTIIWEDAGTRVYICCAA